MKVTLGMAPGSLSTSDRSRRWFYEFCEQYFTSIDSIMHSFLYHTFVYQKFDAKKIGSGNKTEGFSIFR